MAAERIKKEAYCRLIAVKIEYSFKETIESAAGEAEAACQ
jgi:hypothetical protein